MTQTAPDPTALHDLVARVRYKNGWTFALEDRDRGQGSAGLTLIIRVDVPDSYQHRTGIRVGHYMIVPAAAYDTRAWRWWLFQQIVSVEQHEAAEFYRFATDGDDDTDVREVRPYPPNHGPGRDPYQVLELGTVADAETDFLGDRHAGTQETARM
jgi:hypothetical protein